MKSIYNLTRKGFYEPAFEHESCGAGFVVNVQGTATHQIVKQGINVLKNLEHRDAVSGDSKMGDVAGMLTQIPHSFFLNESDRLNIGLPERGLYALSLRTRRREINPRNSLKKQLYRNVEKLLSGEKFLLSLKALVKWLGNPCPLSHRYLRPFQVLGGIDEESCFHYLPIKDTSKLTDVFKQRVIKCLVDKGLLDRSFALKLLAWKHSGFSVDNSVKIPASSQNARVNLSQYIVRHPVSLQKIMYIPPSIR